MSRKRKAVTSEWMVPSSLLGSLTRHTDTISSKSYSSKSGQKATRSGRSLASDDYNSSHESSATDRRRTDEDITETDQEERKTKGNNRFYLSHTAKEKHGNVLYCAAWSTDLHFFHEQIDENSDKDMRMRAGADSSFEKASSSIQVNEAVAEERETSSTKIEGAEKAEEAINPINEIELQHAASSIMMDNNDNAINRSTVEETKAGAHDNFSSTTSKPKVVYCRYLATCGGNRLTIYEVPMHPLSNEGNSTSSIAGLQVHQMYEDVDEDESFYTCVFGGKSIGASMGYSPKPVKSEGSQDSTSSIPLGTIELPRSSPSNGKATTTEKPSISSYDGPQLCCVAGSSSIIKVIDTTRRTLFSTLCGHGDDIYDLQFSPIDPWLLLSACKDESIRLWNVQTSCCIAVFAGHDGHRDAVIKVAWHPFGKMFASSGMDTTVKVWSLEESDKLQASIQNSYSDVKIDMVAMESDNDYTVMKQISDYNAKDHASSRRFKTLFVQLPIFSTSKMHSDYVDCIGFVGGLLMSKSTKNTISLWRPEISSLIKQTSSQQEPSSSTSNTEGKESGSSFEIPSAVLHLRDYQLRNCDIWFVRFAINSDCTQLAIGGRTGEIHIFDVGGHASTVLKYPNCVSTIRMICFSPDDTILIAVCDDATVWRWDVKIRGVKKD